MLDHTLIFVTFIFHIPAKPNMFDSSLHLSYWMDQIERLQYRAALAVTGTWKGTSLNRIYEELGWELLSSRRWFRRLTQFYKIQNNLTPEYLRTTIPPSRSHLFGLRSSNNIPFVNCNRQFLSSRSKNME